MTDEYRDKAAKILDIIDLDYDDSDIGIIADALRMSQNRGRLDVFIHNLTIVYKDTLAVLDKHG